MIGLLDINIGNTQSLLALIKRLNYKVKLCKTKEDLTNIDKLILPGVGAFGKFIIELTTESSALEFENGLSANRSANYQRIAIKARAL